MDPRPSTDRIEELLAQRAWVQRVARALVMDESRADDLEQETWLRALQHPPPRPARAWLGTVLRNAASDMRRGEQRRDQHEGSAPPPRAVPSPEALLARAEIVEQVARAVRTLEEPYRTAILLRYFEDLAPPAIAAHLGLPLETVRTQLRRALVLLRERLDAEKGGDRRKWVLLLAPLVRDPVPTAAAGTGVALIVGGFVMKKALAAAAVAILLVVAWLAWRPGEAGSPGRTGGMSPPDGDVAAGPPVRATTHPEPRVDPSTEEGVAPGPKPSPLTGPRARGVVVDSAGRGIPGARVFSFPFDAPRALGAAEAVAEGATGRLAVADGEGRFILPLAPGAPRWTIVAQAAGFEPSAAVRVLDGAEVRITLDRSCSIAGRVLDLQGRPVPGARLRMARTLDALSWERTAVSGTDGRYRLEGLPRKALQEFSQAVASRLLVEVLADGFAPLRLRRLPVVEEPGGSASFDFVLVPGKTVRGKVVERGTEKPLPGARVVLWAELSGRLVRSDGSRVTTPAVPQVIGEAVAGADGAFAIEHAPLDGPYPPTWVEGLLRIGAWKEGWVQESTFPRVMGTMEPMEQILSLAPAAAVKGRVVDGAGGAVAGAWVLVLSSSLQFPLPIPGVPATMVRTGEDGAYVLPAVAAGARDSAAVEIQARRLRIGEGVAWAGADGTASVQARAGETVTAPDIVLGSGTPCASADFLVVDAAGAPVWGASLVTGTALEAGGPMGLALGTAGLEERTDAEGRARLRWPLERNPGGNPLEKPQKVRVSAPGCATRMVEVLPGTDAVPEIRVALEVGHSLSGRVLDAGGGPAEGAWVSVLDALVPLETAFPPGGAFLFPPRPKKEAGPLFACAQIDAAGGFTLSDLPAGPWNVVAAKSPRNPGVYPARQPVLRAEATGVAADTADLLLRLPTDEAPEAGTVEGVVVDAESGDRVFRFQVELRRGEALAGARFDAILGGAFRIEHVPPGRWTLRVSGAGEYAPVEQEGIEVAAGPPAAPLVVRLRRGATVSGTLACAGGEPLAGGKIHLAPLVAGAGEPFSTGVVGRDGAFRIAHVAPGRYRLVIKHVPGGLLFVGGADRTVEVGEGATEVRVDGLLQPAGRLMVEIRDPRFPPNAWDKVPATREQEAVAREARLEVRDAGGALLCERRDLSRGWVMNGIQFPAGECVVRLLLPGGEVKERRVQIEATTSVGTQPTSVSFTGE